MLLCAGIVHFPVPAERAAADRGLSAAFAPAVVRVAAELAAAGSYSVAAVIAGPAAVGVCSVAAAIAEPAALGVCFVAFVAAEPAAVGGGLAHANPVAVCCDLVCRLDAPGPQSLER